MVSRLRRDGFQFVPEGDSVTLHASLFSFHLRPKGVCAVGTGIARLRTGLRRKAFPAHGEGAPVRRLGRMRSFCRTTGRPRCARGPHQSAALTASPCEGKPEPRIKAFPAPPRSGRRMRCCPVFPSRAKPWQCGTLWGGTTPPSSGGRNTLDDTSPCTGEVVRGEGFAVPLRLTRFFQVL